MRFAGLLFASLLVMGCSATGARTSSFTGSGGGGGDTTGSGGSGAGTTTTSDTGVGGGFNFDGGPDDGGNPNEVAEVFGQSANTLYKLDPTTKVVTVVGDFQGCGGSVIDIAIDKNGQMWGTTFSSLYRIDKSTAVCSFVSAGSYPNSLSFVPEGTVDPSEEALVGYVGSTYVRIDTKSGAVSNIGSLGGGYTSSGDIVSVIGGGTYLTVYGNNCSDCIIEVDPKTGSLKKLIGQVGHSSVFGLAFWGGTAYGFDSYGELFSIDLSNGASTVLNIPNAPADLSFYGAGSSTNVPLTPPH